MYLEGSSASDVRQGETVARGAELRIAAREQEDGPETWEVSYLHLEDRCDGGPVINLRLSVGRTHPRRGEEEASTRW